MNASMPPDGFADEAPASGPPDGFADEPAAAPSPSFISRMAQGAAQGLRSYNDSQLGAPMDLLNRADQVARSGASKAGQFVAEEAGRSGINPKIAAGMGTMMAMTPDILQSAVAPEVDGEATAPNFLRSSSRPMAQRALGLTKRFLNTPFARGKAAQAADVALDNNIIPWSGNPETALNRANNLGEQSGQALGAMRESAGKTPLDPVFDSIEAARQRATNGLRGGAWDAVHRKFDEAQNTLLGLIDNGPDVSLSSVEKAKKLLGNTVNWMADNVSQQTAKEVGRAVENGVETVMRSKGIDMAAYNAQKSTYGAAKTMQKGLANEVAAQAGNNAVSLPTMIAAAGEAATGSPRSAMAAVGAMEALRRRGAGIGARTLEAIPRQLSLRQPLKAATAFGGQASRLSPKPILQSVARLKNPEETANGIPDGGQNPMRQPNNGRQENQGQNNSNGYLKGNHGTPKSIFKKSEKVLTDQDAKNYLRKAKGDRSAARRMAVADGWTIPS